MKLKRNLDWLNKFKKLAFFPVQEHHLDASSFVPLIKLNMLVFYVDVVDGFKKFLSMEKNDLKLWFVY